MKLGQVKAQFRKQLRQGFNGLISSAPEKIKRTGRPEGGDAPMFFFRPSWKFALMTCRHIPWSPFISKRPCKVNLEGWESMLCLCFVCTAQTEKKKGQSKQERLAWHMDEESNKQNKNIGEQKNTLKLKLRLLRQQLNMFYPGCKLQPPTWMVIPMSNFNLDGLGLQTKDPAGTTKQHKFQTIYLLTCWFLACYCHLPSLSPTRFRVHLLQPIKKSGASVVVVPWVAIIGPQLLDDHCCSGASCKDW